MDYQKATDDELIALFKEKDDSRCLGEIYARYRTLVYGVCLQYLKDRDNAKDATMHIFERLQSLLKTNTITYFKSWLYITSRNHCLMAIRGNKGKVNIEISEAIMENELLLHLEDEPELDQNLSKLEKCIKELTQDQQTCVKLFYLEEQCYRDIAIKTGYELTKVKSYIQNGKRNLKICLERNG